MLLSIITETSSNSFPQWLSVTYSANSDHIFKRSTVSDLLYLHREDFKEDGG